MNDKFMITRSNTRSRSQILSVFQSRNSINIPIKSHFISKVMTIRDLCTNDTTNFITTTMQPRYSLSTPFLLSILHHFHLLNLLCIELLLMSQDFAFSFFLLLLFRLFPLQHEFLSLLSHV